MHDRISDSSRKFRSGVEAAPDRPGDVPPEPAPDRRTSKARAEADAPAGVPGNRAANRLSGHGDFSNGPWLNSPRDNAPRLVSTQFRCGKVLAWAGARRSRRQGPFEKSPVMHDLRGSVTVEMNPSNRSTFSGSCQPECSRRWRAWRAVSATPRQAIPPLQAVPGPLVLGTHARH